MMPLGSFLTIWFSLPALLLNVLWLHTLLPSISAVDVPTISLAHFRTLQPLDEERQRTLDYLPFIATSSSAPVSSLSHHAYLSMHQSTHIFIRFRGPILFRERRKLFREYTTNAAIPNSKPYDILLYEVFEVQFLYLEFVDPRGNAVVAKTTHLDYRIVNQILCPSGGYISDYELWFILPSSLSEGIPYRTHAVFMANGIEERHPIPQLHYTLVKRTFLERSQVRRQVPIVSFEEESREEYCSGLELEEDLSSSHLPLLNLPRKLSSTPEEHRRLLDLYFMEDEGSPDPFNYLESAEKMVASPSMGGVGSPMIEDLPSLKRDPSRLVEDYMSVTNAGDDEKTSIPTLKVEVTESGSVSPPRRAYGVAAKESDETHRGMVSDTSSLNENARKLVEVFSSHLQTRPLQPTLKELQHRVQQMHKPSDDFVRRADVGPSGSFRNVYSPPEDKLVQMDPANRDEDPVVPFQSALEANANPVEAYSKEIEAEVNITPNSEGLTLRVTGSLDSKKKIRNSKYPAKDRRSTSFPTAGTSPHTDIYALKLIRRLQKEKPEVVDQKFLVDTMQYTDDSFVPTQPTSDPIAIHNAMNFRTGCVLFKDTEKDCKEIGKSPTLSSNFPRAPAVPSTFDKAVLALDDEPVNRESHSQTSSSDLDDDGENSEEDSSNSIFKSIGKHQDGLFKPMTPRQDFTQKTRVDSDMTKVRLKYFTQKYNDRSTMSKEDWEKKYTSRRHGVQDPEQLVSWRTRARVLDNEESCCICRKVIEDKKIVALDCRPNIQHIGCLSCMFQALDKDDRCPVCRKPVKFSIEV